MLKERTKAMFAQALLQTMETKELSKVRVLELCRLCGTDRQTFYYHFRDKYDLVAWIYESDLQETFLSAHNTPSREQTEFLLCRLQRRQSFYSKAFQDMTQNSLFAYMHTANCRITEALAIERVGGRALTEKERFSIHFVSYAWVCTIAEWINNGCTPAPEIFADYLFSNHVFAHPGFLEASGEK
ncbi:MAG: TetR/AcrR family transcriptional regulator C-terminal domain-containing protein [Oscillospiraceae bacterium]|nr:TetR/AcrR family transcriptional regulator C-terminal domain-containing protein [Oscillospiraceae bacterium]